MKRQLAQAGVALTLATATAVSGGALALAAPMSAWLQVTRDTWSHFSPDASPGSHAGTVKAGVHEFYCRTTGESIRVGRYTSNVWVRTTDNNGHSNVYINVLYLRGGDADGLGPC
jgi:hypothetical protein